MQETLEQVHQGTAEEVRKEVVWRALETGWTVTKVAPNAYKFRKHHNGQTEEYTASGFLSSFIRTCMGFLSVPIRSEQPPI